MAAVRAPVRSRGPNFAMLVPMVVQANTRRQRARRLAPHGNATANGVARRGVGELEAQVMAILWDAGGWLTPLQVGERLTGEPAVAYSTVMTILRRLWTKGALEHRRHGKAFAYHPIHEREVHTGDRLVALLDASRDSEAALSHFLAGLDARRRGVLRRLVDGARS